MENTGYPANKHILHSSIFNKTLRGWQGGNCDITQKNLMYPIFIVDDENAVQPIQSMPGISRYGLNKLRDHLIPLIEKGLQSVLLFGVINNVPKDECGSHASTEKNPVIKAVSKLKTWFPSLTIACDVCLCAYTSHGHCGVLDKNGFIKNDDSIKRLAEVALAYAEAGADIVAPSDMMDGRIGAIKQALRDKNLVNRVSVLSYTAKFASNLYGPFRDASKSAPAFGDRKCYQLPSESTGLALRAAARDVEEGADMLMVKPVLIYMDIVKEIKNKFPEYPMFVYQVSGEFAMIHHAAKAGAIDLRLALSEVLTSLRRSGADVIITYFTPQILDWIHGSSKM
ncbi:delta-aminolevulinic acid dehydratase [Harmonia axyridis]|uniref:delta-aminolevulinic acid dehydratase n=1 Tax=Harmonia axyridis TaxID=115357 RepID=UPI001E2753A9|nr:delta-aminolevulinic acid dehydratase [Harmonia axyridis]